MLDIDAIAEVIAAAVGPLEKRIVELEGREIPAAIVGDKGDKGSPGEPGAPGRDGVGPAGSLIDKDGNWILTFADGSVREMGQVVGKDGRDGADGAPGPEGTPGQPGRDGTDGRDGRDVEEISVEQAGARLSFGFTVGESRQVFDVELPAGPAGADGSPGERGERGADGKLAIARAWVSGVHYEGDIRSHAGGTWQAVKDTAGEPPHDGWICIAGRGADGKDGAGFNPRRLWEAEETYQKLDVVALNGGSFVALHDEPGPCPGDGWMRLTQPGKRGEKGDRGDRGERGERGLPAATVKSMAVDGEGVVTLTNADGSTVTCDLYPLLTRITR